MFDPDFDPRGGRGRSGRNGRGRAERSDDDPIIINVETDGDDVRDGRDAADGAGARRGGGSGRPPFGPGFPRITRRPSRPKRSGSGVDRGTKILIGVVAALAILVGLFFGLARFITDLMWYGQLGFQAVVWTQLGVKVGLWVAYALLMGLVGFLSAWLAIRARPDAADGSRVRVDGDVVEVKSTVSSKTARRVAAVISVIVGAVFGAQFNANWADVLLMFHAQNFGVNDPQFGLDNGFYVFVLPGLRLVMSEIGRAHV